MCCGAAAPLRACPIRTTVAVGRAQGMPFLVEVRGKSGGRLAGFCILRDRYRFPDNTETVIRADVAWCRTCGDFALAEHFSTVAELEHEAEEYFFSKYPEERTPYMQLVMRQALEGQKHGHVQSYQPMLDYLRRRQSPPRCLGCGGIDFVRFTEWETWYEHPQNSSRFRITCRGHIDSTHHDLYDPEGVRMTS